MTRGIAHKFGSDINTDLIISGRYKFSITDPNQLARHVFEDIDPEFYKKAGKGKFFVAAGANFGCGSSREQAPLALKHAGCQAVIAKSFARIFYRNAFNLGLSLIECDTGRIKEGDLIELDIEKGEIRGPQNKYSIAIKPFTRFQKDLVDLGGIVNYYKKYGELKI
ncbi:MAG: 3-isopropylmalate dehydratase [Candidatus Omnitrophota bacterium]|nr:3-isopropylmalate dehydratase [Candidatus Omnitrophota bacterium]